MLKKLAAYTTNWTFASANTCILYVVMVKCVSSYLWLFGVVGLTSFYTFTN